MLGCFRVFPAFSWSSRTS